MPRKRRDTSLAEQTKQGAVAAGAAEVVYEGAEVVSIPDELFGYVEMEILRRVVVMLRDGRAPGNDVERVFLGVFTELDRKGWGARPEALLLGVMLAYSAESEDPIRTHPRDLAKDAQVRYQDLLRVKKLAIDKIRALNRKEKI